MSFADIIIEDTDYLKNSIILNEASVYKGDGICLVAAPDKGRNYDEDAYFKMYDSESLKNPRYVYRIKFKNPELIDSHKNDPHGASTKSSINSKYKKILIKSLTIVNADGDSIWVSLIKEFNKYVSDKYKLPLDLPMPNYEEL